MTTPEPTPRRRRSATKTPADRAAAVERQTARIRKSYKLNVKTRRKFEISGEEDLVKDMVVVLKLANYTNSQIGSIVGCSRGQVGEYLKEDKIQKKLMHLREALPQAALELGRAYLIEAVQAVVHVMRTSRDDAMILKAAAEMFDRFGLPKLTRSENTNNETVTLPGSNDESILDKFRNATPEQQEKAAQLYDALNEGLHTILKEDEDGDS